MRVGIKVGSIIDEVGESDFFTAFFSTVTGLLENNIRGSKYPTISIDFYQGSLPNEKLEKAISELRSIQDELSKYSPDKVIWNIDDRSESPPWGNNISSDITSMANYFVSSTGRDLFDLLLEAFSHALKTKRTVNIVRI